jgi:hypothetical protein
MKSKYRILIYRIIMYEDESVSGPSQEYFQWLKAKLIRPLDFLLQNQEGWFTWKHFQSLKQNTRQCRDTDYGTKD